MSQEVSKWDITLLINGVYRCYKPLILTIYYILLSSWDIQVRLGCPSQPMKNRVFSELRPFLLVVIYDQQFRGTILLMALDLELQCLKVCTL